MKFKVGDKVIILMDVVRQNLLKTEHNCKLLAKIPNVKIFVIRKIIFSYMIFLDGISWHFKEEELDFWNPVVKVNRKLLL